MPWYQCTICTHHPSFFFNTLAGQEEEEEEEQLWEMYVFLSIGDCLYRSSSSLNLILNCSIGWSSLSRSKKLWSNSQKNRTVLCIRSADETVVVTAHQLFLEDNHCSLFFFFFSNSTLWSFCQPEICVWFWLNPQNLFFPLAERTQRKKERWVPPSAAAGGGGGGGATRAW